MKSHRSKDKLFRLILALTLVSSGCDSVFIPHREEEKKAPPVVSQKKEFDARGKLTRCGDFAIKIIEGDDSEKGGSVEINDRAGKAVEKINGFRITDVQCEELLGDGQTDLIVEEYSGGAHCCFTYHVYAPAERKMLLVAETGNASIQEVKDLNGDGKKEIVISDDRFAYFDDLAFASSPMLPMIFCYRGDHYTDCTRDFPEILRQAMAESEDDLRKSAGDESSSKRDALAIYALSLWLGNESETWERLQTTLPENTKSWLAQNRSQIRERMRAPRSEKKQSR